MEQETVELWHRLCVRAMNEPDLKRLVYVLQELNAVLIKEEKAIKEEVKQDSHTRGYHRKKGQSKSRIQEIDMYNDSRDARYEADLTHTQRDVQIGQRKLDAIKTVILPMIKPSRTEK